MKDYSYVYWVHILFVGPLFVYIGYNKTEVSDSVFNFLIILGLVVIVYHSYKLLAYKKLI
jgi:hypothetical protein